MALGYQQGLQQQLGQMRLSDYAMQMDGKQALSQYGPALLDNDPDVQDQAIRGLAGRNYTAAAEARENATKQQTDNSKLSMAFLNIAARAGRSTGSPQEWDDLMESLAQVGMPKVRAYIGKFGQKDQILATAEAGLKDNVVLPSGAQLVDKTTARWWRTIHVTRRRSPRSSITTRTVPRERASARARKGLANPAGRRRVSRSTSIPRPAR